MKSYCDRIIYLGHKIILGWVCLEIWFALQYLAVACSFQLFGIGLPMWARMLVLCCDCGVKSNRKFRWKSTLYLCYMYMVVFYHYFCKLCILPISAIIVKWSTKYATLSTEQFNNSIEKFKKEANSRHLTHKYMTTLFTVIKHSTPIPYQHVP